MNFLRSKLNVGLKVVLVVIVAMLLIILPNVSNAAATQLNPSYYFGIQIPRQKDENNFGYAIEDPRENGVTIENSTGYYIYNIIKYNNATTERYDEGDYYCIRAGLGFNETIKRAEYDVSYDMKEDRNLIINDTNGKLKSLPTIKRNYDKIMALADLMYLPVDDENKNKENIERLLINAGCQFEEFEISGKVELSGEQVKAIQQAALFYFTNEDAQHIFNKTEDENWLNYVSSDNSVNPLNSLYKNNERIGIELNEQANTLYNYLISEAIRIGTDNYNPNSTITLYTHSTNAEETQPIIEVKRDNKIFDLALRKYITKIDGTTLTGNESRVPNVDRTKLDNGDHTSACYKHRKDSVVVEKGSRVTYTLAVYNEGDKAGRATEITDQLPRGLKLKTSGTVTSKNGNVYTITYDETNNKVVFKTTGEADIEAYDGTVIKSDSIEIECEVTADPDETDDKILTNLAWISEEYDSVDDVTITNQQNADRDSEPSTITTKTQDQLVSDDERDYIGDYDINKDKELNNKNECFKGQQDDDDFEKIKIKALNGSYDIVLVKEDAHGEDLQSTATFNVNGVEKQVTGRLTIAKDVKITPENVTTVDTYTIIETVPPDEYCPFDGTIKIEVYKKKDGEKYVIDQIKYYVDDVEVTSNRTDLDVYLNTDGNIYVEVKDYQFDLKLVKRITKINSQNVEPDRLQSIDVSKLNIGGANSETTADYELLKDPIFVSKGDIVTYTLRVYNEGEVDGYASEITEDIPEGLQFLWSEKTGTELDDDTTFTEAEKEAIKLNQDYLWGNFKYDSNNEKIVEISTPYLSANTDINNKITAFGINDGTKTSADLDYKDIQVCMKVVSDNVTGTTIRNEACISKDNGPDGTSEVDDRDSKPEDWVKYEDDEDYDNIVLKSFDLALRKFIIAVSDDTTVEESEYLKTNGIYTRAPQVDTSKLNKTDENGKLITTAIYNHPKEPIMVKVNDYIVYNLRVYNESDIAGYADEITDYLPPHLEFVDGEFNKQYGWKVSEDGRTVTTDYLKYKEGSTDNLIVAARESADGKIELSYKEVPIMCKVKSTVPTGQNVTNLAQVTDDKDENGNDVNDRDSKPDGNFDLPSDENLPGYKDNENGPYVPGQEDDDDFEKIIVREFDLALRKWVTQAIVIEDGKQTVTNTGHQPYDDPEQAVKVELNKKKLGSTTVKFRYSIRIINEGDIEGYAKEITDYVPQGLKFVATDNPGWVDEGNNVISTRLLENTLLKPGEYADISVLLTWVKDENNLGLKTNTAEISEDYNEYGVPDRDSTPDNKKPGEDDIDDAPVILSLRTGNAKTYVMLGLIVLVTTAGGVVLIKKYVL